jgi:hypothetical protein
MTGITVITITGTITKIVLTGITWRHDMKHIVSTTSSTPGRRGIIGNGVTSIRTATKHWAKKKKCLELLAVSSHKQRKKSRLPREPALLFWGSITAV